MYAGQVAGLDERGDVGQLRFKGRRRVRHQAGEDRGRASLAMVRDRGEDSFVGAVGERGTAASMDMDVDEPRYERRHRGALARIEVAGLNPADAGAPHLQPARLENG